MGKKKFTRESDDDGSTDEESVNVISPANTHSCPHVGKAVNISDLKKSLKLAWVPIGRCSQCTKSTKAKSIGPAENKKKGSKKSISNSAPTPQVQPQLIVDPSTPVDVWLCLRCGSQNCCPKSSPTPTCQSHALIHFETPRSDLHCVILNVNLWVLWCYECKQELYLDSYKKLHEAVDHVKRVAASKPALSNTGVKKENFGGSFGTMKTSPSSQSVGGGISPNSILPRARGLNNLGNTCFFNSVMQCLSATHPFVRYLDIHCQKGALLKTPAVIFPASFKTLKKDDSGMGTSSNGSTLSDFDDCERSRKALVTQVEALSLQLAEAGPTTLSLAAFFKEMHSIGPKTGSVNPGHLFGQICKRSPQFRGFQQQDAHELLRHLMDGLRCEEVRRQRLAILKHYGLNDKTDPKTVEEKTRQKVNALSRHSNYTIIDKIFGGHLVSTIVCEQCHNSSQIYEPFLDLSLPLVDHKPPRPGASSVKTNKVFDDEGEVSCFGKNKKKVDSETSKSKYQLKKERELSKKEKRRNKNKAKTNDQPPDDQPAENSHPEEINAKEKSPDMVEQKLPPSEEKESSKVEKDLVENEKSKTKQTPLKAKLKQKSGKAERKSRKSFGSDDEEEEDEDGYSEEAEDDWEWDYGEQWEEGDEKKDLDEPEETVIGIVPPEAEEEKIISNEVQIPKQSLNPLPPERLAMRESSERERSSEPIPEDSTESETGASFNGDVEDNLEETSKFFADSYRPDPKHLDPHMEQLCRRIRKLSVTSSTIYQDNAQTEFALSRQQSGNISDEVEVDTDDEAQLVRLRQEWISRSLTSIASRYQSKKGECSIYSSLSQFTAPELLTGSNRWACDRCSESQRSLNNEEEGSKSSTTVYSNASKQLLLFSPPAVLTIHLKRFQQTVSGLRKDNRHVQFPIDLNIAPFCSSTALSASNVDAGAQEILYDLFGVVEHCGRLQGGHYTAFVKVRPTNTTDFSKFFSEPTTRTDDVRHLVLEIERKCREKAFKENEGYKSLPEISPECAIPPPTGHKWYYISDSSVSEATEERVLKSQAYILFYERVK